ncbi:hypothetical protein EV421DRAFT_2042137 [Armillaria borealis]|uniref:Uncharacterized protein n=1 Tax=Armillaria borealis TaxID=47425 RepID=A0AA39MDS4_9AGAR|nr:hypothetical protein EV421DRAFT_2042137 [Armillaria borealis]
MSVLNACLKVANIAEASGVPSYVENVAKVAVVVFKLLDIRLHSIRKRERTRRVPRNSVRVLQTQLSSSTPSSVCKENGELRVISIFAGAGEMAQLGRDLHRTRIYGITGRFIGVPYAISGSRKNMGPIWVRSI